MIKGTSQNVRLVLLKAKVMLLEQQLERLKVSGKRRLSEG
jgi:hypothetical protein